MTKRIMNMYNKNFSLDFISSTLGISVNSIICIVYDETVSNRIAKG